MKIPRTPERRITPLFGRVRFCSRKGHSLAIFAHPLSPIVLAKSAEDYSWEIAERQLARRSIGAGYAEVWPFCHSGRARAHPRQIKNQSRAFSNRCRVAANHRRNWVRVARSSSLCGRVGADARYTTAQPTNATAKLTVNMVAICASRFTASPSGPKSAG
jgi:hypothetical protein